MNKSKELRNYIKYNTGLFSNKFICKKFNITPQKLYNLQKYLGVNLTSSMYGHDYLTLNRIQEQLDIPKSFLKSLLSSNVFKSKKIGRFTVVEFEEFEKIQLFLLQYIRLSEVKNILNMSCQPLIFHLINENNIEVKKINKRLFMYNKEQIEELSKKLDKKDYLTVPEFASKIFFCKQNVYKMIENNTLEYVKIKAKKREQIFIHKSEIKKFQS